MNIILPRLHTCFCFLLLFLLQLNFEAQEDSSTWKVALELSREEIKELRYDSGAITKISPSKAKEDKVFSEARPQDYEEKASYKNVFQRFLEWLSKKFFDNAGEGNLQATRDIVIWTIVIASLVIIVWLFLRTEISSLVRPKTMATSFNFSDLSEDLHQVNFEQKINAALNAGDFRLAIRWHYLKILFLLDKKHYITFQPFKTNIDYRNELRGFDKTEADHKVKSRNMYQGFIQLSRVYEYVWYGKFPLRSDEFNNHAADFDWFEKQIFPDKD